MANELVLAAPGHRVYSVVNCLKALFTTRKLSRFRFRRLNRRRKMYRANRIHIIYRKRRDMNVLIVLFDPKNK